MLIKILITHYFSINVFHIGSCKDFQIHAISEHSKVSCVDFLEFQNFFLRALRICVFAHAVRPFHEKIMW